MRINIVVKTEEKRLFGRSMYRCEGKIKMDLTKIGCDDVDRINLAQDRGQWRALVNLE
jgi:hypothetical protein